MSQADKRTIQSQQKQISTLKDENADLKRENRQLQSELYKAKLTMTGAAAGVPASVEAIVERASKEHQELQETIEELTEHIASLQSKLGHFSPTILEIQPTTGDDVPKLKSVLEEQGLRATKIEKNRPAWLVEAMIYIMPLTDLDKPPGQRGVHIADFWNSVIGELDDLKREIHARAPRLAARAPFPENFKGPYIHDVSRDIQYEAICDLALHRSDPELHPDIPPQMKNTFERFIKPHLSGDCTEQEAYDIFRKSVDNTYEHMARFERGNPKKPHFRRRDHS